MINWHRSLSFVQDPKVQTLHTFIVYTFVLRVRRVWLPDLYNNSKTKPYRGTAEANGRKAFTDFQEGRQADDKEAFRHKDASCLHRSTRQLTEASMIFGAMLWQVYVWFTYTLDSGCAFLRGHTTKTLPIFPPPPYFCHVPFSTIASKMRNSHMPPVNIQQKQ